MATSKRTCSVPNCEKPYAAKGYCGMHYNRVKRHGSTDKPRRNGPTMEQRFWAKVDQNGPSVPGLPELGKCWQWTGATANLGYSKFYVEGKYLGGHRVSYEMHVGPIPDGMEVDHICHNTACVNPDHLRLASSSENSQYRSGAQENNQTGVRGVRWHPERKYYEGYVTHRGKYYHVGCFNSLEEAAKETQKLRERLFTFKEFPQSKAIPAILN